MVTYLDRIVARHREAAATDERSLDALVDAARATPPARGFGRALTVDPTLSVIAEIKRRSPSKGALNVELEPATLATTYA
ncbi:MAG: indole-3-glycerol-phosphate synthase TrpC, partial [Ilumatobacteraceae bacterium]